MQKLLETVDQFAHRIWNIPAVRKWVTSLLYLAGGGFISLIFVAVVVLNGREDLSVWHEVHLENEFEAGDEVETFAEYLALEEKLFAEVESRVYAVTPEATPDGISRYAPGSPANPSSYDTDWNRTFEWKVEDGKPKGGVLLLHGMSDSPYSLRHLGKSLHARGMHVIGLRLPGHGTAPSGLKYFDWKDMESAVNLTMKHLEAEVGEAPLYLAGYSNGGALAVHYGSEMLKHDDLPKVEGIILCSPAVGVTPAASLAIWQRRLGYALGMEKLAWNAIAPEYDPFKYVSFAVNAGVQVHDLTVEIKKDLGQLKRAGKLKDYPPVLAFQSLVDATVSTPALIDILFGELPDEGHELVLFDINRTGRIESLVKSDPLPKIRELIRSTSKTYAISMISNDETDSVEVKEYHYRPDRSEPVVRDLGMVWPEGLYSLSHIAIPFPETDELYGSDPDLSPTGYHIGSVALRGERGVLAVSATDQLRLRFNPFYPLVEEKVLGLIGGGAGEMEED